MFGEKTLFNVYEFNVDCWLSLRGTPGDKNDKTITHPPQYLLLPLLGIGYKNNCLNPFCMIMFRLYVHHASRCSSIKTEILALSFGSEPDFSSCPLHLQTWC